MFKRTITFEDFNGEEKTKDFYFHFSKAEVMALAHGADALQERVKRIENSKDGLGILKEFRALIELAVGVRSEDGERFVKDDLAKSQLMDSPAFDVLLMELSTNANGAVDFMKQLLPEKMQKELQEYAKKQIGGSDPFADTEDKRPAYQKEHRLPSHVEFREMSKEEMQELWKWREQNKI